MLDRLRKQAQYVAVTGAPLIFGLA